MGELPYEPTQCQTINCPNEVLYGKRWCAECREVLEGETIHFMQHLKNVTYAAGILGFCLFAGWMLYQWLGE